MSEVVRPGTLVVILTFFVGFILSVAPLPEWLELGRPAWVCLIVIYWVIATPHRVGVVGAWLAGLYLDVLTGSVLGQNALALALIAYAAYVLHLRIRVFPTWQQCLTIGVLVGVYELSGLLIRRSVSVSPSTMWYWLPVLISALIWPWVMMVLRYVRRQFYVN